MIKILNASPTVFSKEGIIGGGERYVDYVSEALGKVNQKLEFTVNSISLSDSKSPLTSAEVPKLVARGDTWSSSSFSFNEVLSTIQGWDVVIVHQCMSDFGLMVASLAKVLDKVVLGFDHGGGEHQSITNRPSSLDMFDRIIAYSEFGLSKLKPFSAPTELIRGPVPKPASISPKPERAGRYLLASLGRILPHKNFDLVVSAMPRESEYFIMGNKYDKDYVSYITRLAKELDKKVFIREGLSDEAIRDVLNQADYFIQPSSFFDYKNNFYEKTELLGLAPLEALSLGNRTIVGPGGALPELAELPGCNTFSNLDELTEMLKCSPGAQTRTERQAISRAVEQHYGLTQFGQKLACLIRSYF